MSGQRIARRRRALDVAHAAELTAYVRHALEKRRNETAADSIAQLEKVYRRRLRKIRMLCEFSDAHAPSSVQPGDAAADDSDVEHQPVMQALVHVVMEFHADDPYSNPS